MTENEILMKIWDELVAMRKEREAIGNKLYELRELVRRHLDVDDEIERKPQ